MRALLRLADADGVSVVVSRLPGDLLGCFLPGERRIHLDIRLTPAERRSVLAHELGHVHFGHPCDGSTPGEHEMRERQADRFAARLLIDHRSYARLERINPDPEFIADELGVTTDLIDVYRTACLARTCGASYALPRLGAGQWAYREAIESV